MTENLSLREVLSELAGEIQTIELGARVQQTRQTLRRRRAGGCELSALFLADCL